MPPNVESALLDALDAVPPAPLAAIRARAGMPQRHRRSPAVLLMTAMVATVAVLCALSIHGVAPQAGTVANAPSPMPSPRMT
ncbi:MAG TPA: hypothetical protein VIJ12_08455 [Candidatus Baltobacteraceae bacterium]